MKNIFRLIVFIVLFFTFIFESLAIKAPSYIDLNSKTSSSISISWENIDNVYWYYVNYSTETWLENGYDNQSDVIFTNSYELVDLPKNSTYYISIISVDEVWEISLFSDEIVVDIFDWNDNVSNDEIINWEKFILESVNIASSNILELIFSTPLDSNEDAAREFKITNKNDSLDKFDVLSSKINELNTKTLYITLDKNIEIWNEYEIVIVAITDFNGNNIESWIDNSEVFYVDEINDNFLLDEININNQKEVESGEDILLNSAWLWDNEQVSGSWNELSWTLWSLLWDEDIDNESNVDKLSWKVEQTWVSWQNLSNNEINNTTLWLAWSNDSLPKTGSEHILLIILSIILGTLIFKFKNS